MANKNDDYGYFGKGIDGYVHYKQAFDRNFSENKSMSNTVKQQPKPVQPSPVVHSAPKDSPQNRFISDCHSKEEFDKLHKEAVKALNVTSFTDPYELYDPLDADETNVVIDNVGDTNSYKPRHKHRKRASGEISTVKIFIMLALTWLAAMFCIIGIPTLILTLLTGSYSAADSGIGILIFLFGIVFIIFH